MSYTITCPYCFKQMKDDQVLFRSEKVNQGEDDIIPDDYDDLEDFLARYQGNDKDSILQEYRDWDFFSQKEDEQYTAFWKRFGGTTEYSKADEEIFGYPSYMRRVINPNSSEDQRFIKVQPDGDRFIRDADNMVTQIELTTGERCHRRVCMHCHNPLPSNYGKTRPRFITVVGITGAGKTVYLSQLLRHMKEYTTKVGLVSNTKSTSTTNYLNANLVRVKSPLPAATPVNRLQQPLFYDVSKNRPDGGKETATFVLYDVAGEVFSRDFIGTGLIDLYAPFIEHADGIIVLIDPMQFEGIRNMQDSAEILADPTQALQSIYGIVSKERMDVKCQIPLAICISKVDTKAVQDVLNDSLRNKLLNPIQVLKDQNGFNLPRFNAKEYNPIAKELDEFMRNNEMPLAQEMFTQYADYDYFAFTALGCEVTTETDESTGETYQSPVGPVLPQRVEEPLFWLFYELGFIDANEEVFTPAKKQVFCPECGSVHTEPIDPPIELVKGIGPFKKVIGELNYRCLEETCGFEWDNTE